MLRVCSGAEVLLVVVVFCMFVFNFFYFIVQLFLWSSLFGPLVLHSQFERIVQTKVCFLSFFSFYLTLVCFLSFFLILLDILKMRPNQGAYKDSLHQIIGFYTGPLFLGKNHSYLCCYQTQCYLKDILATIYCL